MEHHWGHPCWGSESEEHRGRGAVSLSLPCLGAFLAVLGLQPDHTLKKMTWGLLQDKKLEYSESCWVPFHYLLGLAGAELPPGMQPDGKIQEEPWILSWVFLPRKVPLGADSGRVVTVQLLGRKGLAFPIKYFTSGHQFTTLPILKAFLMWEK